jgi:hypothetical protein
MLTDNLSQPKTPTSAAKTLIVAVDATRCRCGSYRRRCVLFGGGNLCRAMRAFQRALPIFATGYIHLSQLTSSASRRVRGAGKDV